MRLQSFLSQAGISSRRSVVDELEAGKVKVNGEVVRIPSYPIFPGKDQVTYLDQEVTLSSRKAYFIFNKPCDVITTAKDTHGRKTVLDYFKNVKERLYPVGRLDQDTTGLLILTNDGDLAHKLMHPSFGVEKAYEALLDKAILREQIEQLQNGVVIEGEKTSPCKIRILNPPNRTVIPAQAALRQSRRTVRTFGLSRHSFRNLSEVGAGIQQVVDPRLPCKGAASLKHAGMTQVRRSRVEIILHEGRKRQIRNMFQAIGIKVLHLHRKRYGPLNLKGLTPGKNRPLTDQEVKMLCNAVSRESKPQGGNRGRQEPISSEARERISSRDEPAHDASARQHRGNRLRRRDSFDRR